MTVKDSILMQIIARAGWTVAKAYSDELHWHWRAYRPENPDEYIMGFTIQQLFQDWTERNDVLAEFFGVKIIQKEENHAR